MAGLLQVGVWWRHASPCCWSASRTPKRRRGPYGENTEDRKIAPRVGGSTRSDVSCASGSARFGASLRALAPQRAIMERSWRVCSLVEPSWREATSSIPASPSIPACGGTTPACWAPELRGGDRHEKQSALSPRAVRRTAAGRAPARIHPGQGTGSLFAARVPGVPDGPMPRSITRRAGRLPSSDGTDACGHALLIRPLGAGPIQADAQPDRSVRAVPARTALPSERGKPRSGAGIVACLRHPLENPCMPAVAPSAPRPSSLSSPPVSPPSRPGGAGPPRPPGMHARAPTSPTAPGHATQHGPSRANNRRLKPHPSA